MDSASVFRSVEEKTVLEQDWPTANLLTCLLTYSMEHSPSWEANRVSVSQEIHRILWNLKVHYHLRKCPLPVRILKQMDSIHALTSHFLKIHINIILPSMRGPSKLSYSFRFSHQNPLCTFPLPHTYYMPRPSRSSQIDYPHNIWWGMDCILTL